MNRNLLSEDGNNWRALLNTALNVRVAEAMEFVNKDKISFVDRLKRFFQYIFRSYVLELDWKNVISKYGITIRFFT